MKRAPKKKADTSARISRAALGVRDRLGLVSGRSGCIVAGLRGGFDWAYQDSGPGGIMRARTRFESSATRVAGVS